MTRGDDAYRIGGTRAPLDSVVYLYREGLSVESIVECYPVLTLEEVHGALAFYLANQAQIDQYLCVGERIAWKQHKESREVNAELIARLRRARHESPIPG